MRHPDHETLSPAMDGEWHELDASRCIVEICADETLRAKWARYHLARDAMRRERLDTAAFQIAARVREALREEPSYSNVTAIGAPAPAVPGTPDEGDPGEAAPVPGDAIASAASGPSAASSRGADADARAARGARGASGPDAGGVAAGGEERRAGSSWPRTAFAGFGIAAGAALVTVLGLEAWRGEAPLGATGPGTVVAVAPASGSGATVAGGGEGTIAPSPESSEVARAAEGAPSAGDAFSRQVPGAPLPEVEFVANTGAYWTSPSSSTRRSDSEERLNMFLSQHIEHSPTAERQGMLPYSRLVGYDERPADR